MSFLLNGNKMRRRLAQILAQAAESEANQEKNNEIKQEQPDTHTSSVD